MLLRQVPYSPDSNLCDSYVFPRLESIRDDFESRDDLEQFLTREMPNFTADRMTKALEELVQIMKKLVKIRGNYL